VYVKQTNKLRVVTYATMRRRVPLPAVFIDVHRAFDSVWHEALLVKAGQAGITGNLWRWLQAFLSDRSFFIDAKGIASDPHPVRAGVPQGCVLSALLFILFLNDLTVPADCTLLKYADDMAVYPVPPPNDHKTLVKWDVACGQSLARALASITELARRWKIVFGADKTNLVVFNRTTIDPALPPLRLTGFDVAHSFSYKYLGLILQQDMRWSEQAAAVAKKISALAFLLGRLCRFDRPPSANCIHRLALATLYSVAG